MINITMDDAISHMDAIVMEAGEDFRYLPKNDHCVYLAKDSEGNFVPDCIVGKFLVRIGVPIDEIKHCEGWLAESALVILQDEGVIGEVEASVPGFLFAIQRRQDERVAWGDALHYAKNWLEVHAA